MANWWDKYSEPATKPAAGSWWAKYEAEPSFDDVQSGVATDAPSFGNVQSAAQSTAPGSGPLLDPAQSERPGFLTALGRALQFQASSSLGMQALDRLTGGAGTDLATLGAGGAVTGTGRAIEGVERLANEPVREAGEVGGLLANIGRAMGVAGPAGAMALHGATRGEAPLNDAPAYQPSALSAGLKAVGEDMSGAVTPAMKQAMRDTQMDGDVLSPSTWTLGRNPSARGLLGHVAKTGGEMAPIVGTAFVNPALAVGAAAGQSASGAYEENADYFLKLPPAELAQVPLFRDLVERGVAPERARAMVADEAGRASMAPAAVIGAGSGVILSGAATRPLARAMAARFGDKFSTRLLANAVEMPLEGGQEVVESASGRKGANTATGADRSLTEGTFADFAMGMAATGPAAITHSVGGSIDTERVDGEVRNADQERARRLVDQIDRSAQRVETPESRAVDAGREAAAAIFAEADASTPVAPVTAQEAVQAAPAQQPAVVPVEPSAPATPRPEAPVLARNDARLAQLEAIPEPTLFEREEMELLRNAVDRSRAESDPRQPGVGDAENARAARIADMAATFYETMPQEIGWSEIGGRVIREPERADGLKSEVVGRTSWVGKAGPSGESNFWRMRPDASLKEKEAHEAFAKAARGERLRPIEQRFIDYARKTADGYAADQMEASELYENQDEADRRAALDYLRDSDGMDVAVEDAAEALTLIELANRAADAGIDPEAYLAEDDAFYAARLWRAIKESGYGAVDPAEASNPARRDQGQEGRPSAAPEGSAEEVTSPPRFSRRDDGIVVEELDDAEAERVIADMQRRQRASLDERADPLVEGFKELAKNPTLFRNQPLKAKTVPDLTREAGGMQYAGRSSEDGVTVHRVMVDQREGGKAEAKIMDDGSEVWIDVSKLTSGGGKGDSVYNLAHSLAANTGKQFREDPMGLSDSAVTRRPVQQTAAILKTGTAEHIAPGEYLSTDPANRPGAPKTRPIKYDAQRRLDPTLREHLLTTYHNAVLAVPEIEHYGYDPARDEFVDERTGEPVGDDVLDRLASDRRASPVREAMVRVGDAESGQSLAPSPTGRDTVKTAILAQSLLRAKPSEVPSLLGEYRRKAASGDGLGRLEGILPSKSDKAPADAGVSVSGAREAKDAAEAKVAKHWGRGAVSRLKSRGRVEFVTKAEVIERELGGLRSEDDVRGVDGFYDPETGKAYVIADSGASDADLPGVLSHEVLHANGEQFLGSEGFNKLKNAFARLRNRDKEIGAAYERVPQDTDAKHVDEEALSYLAQEAPKHRFSQRLVDETKLFLNRMGIPLDWLNANAAAVRKIAALNLRDAGNRDVATFNRDGVKFQRVFHGTPHRGIENTGFKLNKIGTGEGAQAYGYGMYFAGKRDVAEHYRNALSEPMIEGKTLSEVDAPKSAKDVLRYTIRNNDWERLDKFRREGHPEYVEAWNLWRRRSSDASGQLYQAEIPEDSDLLDWDKPLSEQPEKVRERLTPERMGLSARVLDNGYMAFVDESNRAIGQFQKGGTLDSFRANWMATLGKLDSGRAIYRWLDAVQERASSALNAAGIPGLRYLDGGSRGKGDGSHNYVIWDEALLTPEKAQITPMYSRRNDQTETPEFKRWFGDSVVTVDGKPGSAPLVVYHGTRNGGFNVFDDSLTPTDREKTGGFAGIYFTPIKRIAESYAGNETGSIYSAFLRISNPLRLPSDQFPGLSAGHIYRFEAEKIQRAGYDGVITEREYVAFRPEQIKSATGNTGAFDPANPDIRFSRDTKRSAVADGVFRDTRGNDPAKRIEGATTPATPPNPQRPKFNSLSEFWVDNIGKPLYDAINGSVGALMRKMQLAENLPPEAKKAWREYRQRIGEAQKTVREIGGAARDLTPDEREMVSDFIEREMKAGVTPPEKVERMGTIMSSIMRKQSDELVRLGMLSEEARDRWDGRYLPRFYAKHLATSPFSKELRRVFLQGIKGSHLKGRGMFETVETADVPRYKELGWEVRDGDPAKGGKVTMWKDFTPAQRQKMGEVRDAMFRFARGYTETQTDIAKGKLFEQIANTIARTDDNAGTFVQVPDTKIPGTGVRKFGNLSGMYVPREVLSQLRATVSPDSALMKAYLKGLSWWKEGKTTLNPVTHVNNVVSNVVMADLAGVNLLDPRSFKLYAETFRDYAREGTAFKEAQAAGLFGNEWFGNEVAQWVPVPAEVRSAQTDAGIAAAFANKGLAIAQAGREAMGRAYQAEDQFFKLLLFKQARAKGLDPNDAVEWAERFVFDYSKAPAGVRLASRTLFPFANYTSKAIPALTFAATHYPWRIAKWVGLLSAVSTYGLSQIHGDDDEAKEAEGKLMPEYMKGGSSFFGVPKAIRLPYNTDEGDAMYVDISRFLPLGDLFDANNQMGGVPLPAPLTPNNPVITTAIAMLANKDSFTGKDLVSESDTGSEAAWKRTAWLWKQMAPNNPVVPGTHNFNRLAEAAAAASGTELGPYTGLDYNGNTISPARAVAQSFGVKLRPVDFERERGFQRSALDAELRELKSKRTKLNRNQSIASSVRDRELESIEAKIEEVMRRIDDLESIPSP